MYDPKGRHIRYYVIARDRKTAALWFDIECARVDADPEPLYPEFRYVSDPELLYGVEGNCQNCVVVIDPMDDYNQKICDLVALATRRRFAIKHVNLDAEIKDTRE